MRRFAILFSAVALTYSGVAARAQENATIAKSIEPTLKACTDKNPPPCADRAPKAIHAPDPEYSKQAAKAKINGMVVLAMVVGTDGRAHDISVIKPLGYGLDEEAVKAVKKWRFKPGQSAGKPVAVEIRVEAAFRYPYPD
jgi:TonB family protein